MNTMIPMIESAGGLLATFALHATVLLVAAWGVERLRAVRQAGWAEWVWRVALFGAFCSLALQMLPKLDGRAIGEGALSAVSAGDAADQSAGTMPAPSGDARRAAAAPALEAVDADATSSAAGTGPGSDPMTDAFTPTPAAVATSAATAEQTVPARAPDLSLAPPRQAIVAVLVLWLLGTFAGLVQTLRQALGLFALRRRLLLAGDAAEPDLCQEAEAVAARLGLRLPTLRIVPGLPSPLALPGMVVLPSWALQLELPRLRAMLAHELAHLQRRDPHWRALHRLALAPLWWHPLAWHARRRLEALAETQCDAAAVRQAGPCAQARAGSARALAECLAECLARHRRGDSLFDTSVLFPRRSGWALAMAEPSEGIVGRVRDLLENPEMQTPPPKRRWRWIAAACALAVLIALPAVTMLARNDHALSVEIREGGSRHGIYSNLAGDERFHVKLDGAVGFTADEGDVATLGPGAGLTIERREAGTTRKIEIAREGGGIVRRYLVDDAPRPLDADGRAWLARQIRDIYRMSGHDAAARAQRILARGGSAGLIAEIEAIGNPHVRVAYIDRMLTLVDLDAAQIAQVFTWIDATDSDFDRRRMLEAVLARSADKPERHASMLHSAQRMGSDFERAEWLSAAARTLPANGETLAGWVGTLNAFDSDFERRRVIETLAQKGQPRVEAMAVALVASNGLASDFERRSALEALADQRAPLDVARYIAVADRIDSDFERREALIALIARGAPDADTSRALLRSVREMQSDFERTQVLAALAARMPHDVALIDDYRAVTRGMSEHERGEAERALERFYPEG